MNVALHCVPTNCRPFLLGAQSLVLLVVCILAGCNEKPSSETEESTTGAGSAEPVLETEEAPPELADATLEPKEIEVSPEELLASTLSPEQLAEGWVSLFDGQSLYGWFHEGDTDWSVVDGAIKVTSGDRDYLCTNFQMSDYEFQVDFRSDEETNSGIFLRTGAQPGDVSTESLELNIAPPSNPFPTGSFVQRKKLDPADLGDFDPTTWHNYHVRLEGTKVTVKLDGKTVLELDDKYVSESGHISLQHNSGTVEFKNILLRPIHAKPLTIDDKWEESWTKSKKDDSVQFNVESTTDGIKLTGGLGQLQSKEQFDNFFLNASYTLARPDVNSGIFFRCIADNMLDGYECQVNHETVDGDPLRPGDAGAGAIFRRSDARIVVGDGTTPTYIAILANGAQISTWVNGLQVNDFRDDREPDENPRRGLRLKAGPISLQSHDPSTDATFHTMSVSRL